MWIELFKDFLYDMRVNRLRALLTLIAITWGTLSVVLLLAFGEGLGIQMRSGMQNAYDRIFLIYAGETSKVYQGLPMGRRIRFVEDDLRLLQRAIPFIDMASPQYRSNVTLTNGKFKTTTECEGVAPEFEEMRRMYPVAGGRFLNESDVRQQRRVLFLGHEIAKDIFGEDNPIGRTIMVDEVPFTVVGVMQKKMQTAMNNGPDIRRAIMPHSTFKTMYGRIYLNSMVIRPQNASQQEFVKQQIAQILGAKYRFDPTDERAMFIWDTIEADKIGERIFLGVQIFLGSVGLLTLLIAGVGVANVMYVVVKERTREIGIKRALGARKRYILAQFIFEALLLAGIGGFIGIMISYGIISVARMFAAEEGVMYFLGHPRMSATIMILTTLILTVIGLLAGFFPARKAANLDPVESLRYE